MKSYVWSSILICLEVIIFSVQNLKHNNLIHTACQRCNTEV